MKRTLIFLFAVVLTSCAPKSELDSALSYSATLEAYIADKEGIISDKDKEIDQLASDNSSLETSLTDLQESYDELEVKYDTAKNNITRLTKEVNQLLCEDEITDMKYENILDVSTIMAAWWAKQPGVERVQGTYRDTIWSNADTKIHAIRFISKEDHQPYVEHFLVYFREFGMQPAIFWIGGQCWLDAP